MKKTNETWSDILAYKPQIELSKRPRKYSQTEISNDISRQSGVLTNFITYIPSKTITIINNSISNMEYTLGLIETYINKFDADFIYKYSENDKEYINECIDKNKDINGNAVYEVYDIINKECNSLKKLNKNIIEKYYGEDITLDDIKIKEEVAVEVMKDYEITGQAPKINYTSLAIDTYRNKIIQLYAEDMAAYTTNLYTTVTLKPALEIQGNNNAIKTVINKKYNKELKASEEYINQYNTLENSDYLNNLLNKSCKAQEDMNYSINADISVPKYKDDTYISIIMEMKDTAIKTAFSSVDDLVKGLVLETSLKQGYAASLSEREGLKNIFSNVE